MEQDSDDQRADSVENDPVIHPSSANRVSEKEEYTFKSFVRSQTFKFNKAALSEKSFKNPKENTKKQHKMSVDGQSTRSAIWG